MRYRPIGKSGMQASIVGLGAWAIGGWLWGGADKTASIDAIRASLDNGTNLIDTAPVYGFGLSEEIIGEAIEGRRDEVLLATKCGLVWQPNKREILFVDYEKEVHKYLGADSIRNELEQSLKRLRTDHIDLYQTHWQDSSTPIEETMTALLDMKDQGKILAIGVSNVNIEQLTKYRSYGQIDSDQESFHMMDRKKHLDLLSYGREHEIAFLAYSPLHMGLLTGKIGPKREFPVGDIRRDNSAFSVENRIKIGAMLDKMKPIAEGHGITIAQLVIAWTAAQLGVTHVLCGARNVRQAVENSHSGDVILSDDDIAAIDRVLEEYSF